MTRPLRGAVNYGDVWDYRVDTTSATVGWRDRWLGLLHSPYQPTEPALFHEMMTSLQVDYREFTLLISAQAKVAPCSWRRIIRSAEFWEWNCCRS